ncbi:hypothetical protein U1Q18_026074, partial [Sarracenia purpurea var. burkii]
MAWVRSGCVKAACTSDAGVTWVLRQGLAQLGLGVSCAQAALMRRGGGSQAREGRSASQLGWAS